MGDFGQWDAVEFIGRKVFLPEVYDFFPQGYFPRQDPDEMEAIPANWDGGKPSLEEKESQRKKEQRRESYERQRRKRWAKAEEKRREKIATAEREEDSRKRVEQKLLKSHYLPNPDFTVSLDMHRRCRRVAVTWIYKGDIDKWVMLKADCNSRVLNALAKRNYVQSDADTFIAKSGPIRYVKLFRFLDPVRRSIDRRFFWIQVVFNCLIVDKSAQPC